MDGALVHLWLEDSTAMSDTNDSILRIKQTVDCRGSVMQASLVVAHNCLPSECTDFCPQIPALTVENVDCVAGRSLGRCRFPQC